MQVFAYVLFLQMIQNVRSLKYWDPLFTGFPTAVWYFGSS